MTSNYINKVAIIGAGGNVGSFITASLLATNRHAITALTRHDGAGQHAFPAGVAVAPIDYARPETLVAALRGQDALVVTLGVSVPEEVHHAVVRAAAEARVPWVLPNEWGADTDDEATRRDLPMWERNKRIREAIKELGRSSFISLCTGYWYEWSLSIPAAWGFHFPSRTVTLVDDGDTRISVSTWPQVGRAAAALLSLPIHHQPINNTSTTTTEEKTCLDSLRDRTVFVNSFTLSQRDMLQSVLRVTGDAASDWTILKQPHEQRFRAGRDEVAAATSGGERAAAFAKMIYARVLYPDGVGNFERSRGTLNEALALPREDVDEATARAIERARKPLFADLH
ncbi:hypothetical protein N3K66_007977 [Trichothecium roseum]|uniref:Uncharacterized protein n=1 Tax=Trichothecium roseum TaxID=47278 RepID=A0ACC0UTA8_9HYPO|nr:hypothetical protein N3K66_007977 [Trichothecium roseum]